MNEAPGEPPEERPKPRAVVADAIQDLTAARLGRGFLPLAVLFAWGSVDLLRSQGRGLWIALGAILTSAAMLAYGLRIVQRTLGRDRRLWMRAALVASIIPPVYGLYVLAWHGFRAFVPGVGGTGVVAAILYVAAGAWVLRSWMKVVEVQRLARIMSFNLEGDAS